ncbi:MAG: hypothetical protein QOI20_1137 [Acidimicrobiaceae bacterium]|jgi:hypothetical protein|nr:hypothetical protein [Acidimicrobiaceae bacterium]
MKSETTLGAVGTLIAGLGLALTPFAAAHAAVLSGNIRAGAGTPNCLGLSCNTFLAACSPTAANDIDASIRDAGPAIGVHSLNWSATVKPANAMLMVDAYDAGCRVIATSTITGFAGTVAVPGGSRWIAIYPRFPAADVQWTIG